MSFGDHLEELRTRIAKSVIGLVVGFIIGLCIAEYLVGWIQFPLKQALENHMIASALDQVKRDYANQNEELPTDVEAFITREKMISEKVFVEVDEVTHVGTVIKEYQQSQVGAAASEKAATSQAKATAAPPTDSKEKDPADKTATSEKTPPKPEPGSSLARATILNPKAQPPRPVLVQTRVWRPIRAVVKTLSAQEAFMIWIKAAFVSGLVISSPYVFFQIWAFVAAGLYPHEKRYMHIYVPFSLGLFLVGAAVAFFLVFPFILQFLFKFNKAMDIDPDPRISEWLSFVLLMPLGFGIAFQLPLVMLFLNRIRIFSVEAYINKWKIAILVVFILSAVLTPSPDPVSMMLLAVPLTGLYFLGIGLCNWMPRQKNPFAESYEP